ncbi:MAG: hypothetical protein EXS37_15065 [Opitutus sp.]|nr:hypothetical protein [Opitutus sp.]
MAFVARNVASSRDASFSCSTSFAASGEFVGRAPPMGPFARLGLPELEELPALAARFSRSTRQELRGVSGAAVEAAVFSGELSALRVSEVDRAAPDSDDDDEEAVAPVETGADGSLFSAGAPAQPANANTTATGTTKEKARRVMVATEQELRANGKP